MVVTISNLLLRVERDTFGVEGLPTGVNTVSRAPNRSCRSAEAALRESMTVVSGLESSIDVDALDSTLKQRLTTGSTVADRRIELQNDHAARLPAMPNEEGFRVAWLLALVVDPHREGAVEPPAGGRRFPVKPGGDVHGHVVEALAVLVRREHALHELADRLGGLGHTPTWRSSLK